MRRLLTDDQLVAALREEELAAMQPTRDDYAAEPRDALVVPAPAPASEPGR